jgi:hypothetical protein
LFYLASYASTWATTIQPAVRSIVVGTYPWLSGNVLVPNTGMLGLDALHE